MESPGSYFSDRPRGKSFIYSVALEPHNVGGKRSMSQNKQTLQTYKTFLSTFYLETTSSKCIHGQSSK